LYLSTDRGEFVVGVTSRGYNNTWAPCEEGGIYGRPDYVFDWIEDVTGRTLPRPDCDDNEDPDEEDPDTDPPEQSSNHAPQPTAEPFVVVQGGQGRTWVETNDPDFGDTHHFQVLEGGEPGSTTIDEDGKVTYEASDEVVGFLEIVIAVTDSGTPALTETVAISVEVLARDGNGAESPEGAGCGCQASRSSLGWLWIPLLAFLGWRIRQSRHGMAG